jgi:hypothetical protein
MDINELWSTLQYADDHDYIMCNGSKKETPESIEEIYVIFTLIL